MNTVEQRVEKQVQFWSMLGPFLFLVTSAVLIFKLSAHWYFPLSALIGIPLCVKWKLKGMAAALASLLALTLLSYQNLDLEERYWHVGMALAMAFSFIILTLSAEEVEGVISKLQRESQSRLENFLRLDEAAKTAEDGLNVEKTALNARLTALTFELSQVQEDKQTFYKLAQLAKDELVQIRQQQELLQQDLLYKKQQICQLNEKLEETEITLQEFVNSDPEQNIQRLTDNLDQAVKHQSTLQAKLEAFQKQLGESEKEKELFADHLKEIRERYQSCTDKYERSLKEKEQADDQLKNVQNQLVLLSQEKEQIQDTFTVLRQQYEKVLNSETACKQAEIAYQKQIDDMQKDIDSKNDAFLSAEEQIRKLTCALETAHKECSAIAKDKELVEKELQLKKIELADFQKSEEQINKLTCELETAQEQCLAIAKDKEQVERDLELKKIELSDIQERMAKVDRHREELPNLDQNTRDIENLYLQLKSQFREKSSVLDQTRRELFVEQEKVLSLTKELEERELYSQSESESILQREHKHLITAFEQLQEDYRQEVETMQALISKLLNSSD